MLAGGASAQTAFRKVKSDTMAANQKGMIKVISPAHFYPLPTDAVSLQYVGMLNPTTGRLEKTTVLGIGSGIRDAQISAGTYGKEDILDVGAAGEQYSDFSTAVAAAGSGDIIELSSATFTESGTVTLPANSTLRMADGALLSGTFTLVGNNSQIDAGTTRAFGDNVTITGTWNADKTLVRWFGMNGDANESGEFAKAVAFCKLTTGKTLSFMNDDYYLEAQTNLIDGDMTVEGNGARLRMTSAVDYSYVLKCSGSNGSYYNLTKNAIPMTQWVEVAVGSPILATLSQGDMVKIISDEEYALSKIGESKIVKAVHGNRIVFTEPIFDTYLTANTARIQRVNAITVHIKDLTLIANGDPITLAHQFGVSVEFTKFSTVKNVVTWNCSYAGVNCQNNYGIQVDIRTEASDSYGLGYSIAIGHAETSGKYTTQAHWCRHAVTTGGGSTDGGLPWNWVAENCIAYTMWTHSYDAHPSVGSGTYRNCLAYGGINPTDTANFEMTWSVGTAYTTGQIVSYGGTLYSAVTNNTGQTPTATNNTYWRKYLSGTYGFNILTKHPVTISNCEVRNHEIGVLYQKTAGNNNSLKNGMVIDGLTCKNVRAAISAYHVKFQNCSFDNIFVVNDSWKPLDNGYNAMFRIQNDTLINTGLGRFYGTNIAGFYIDTLVAYGESAEIRAQEITCKGAGWYVLRCPDTVSFTIDKMEVDLPTTNEQAYYENTASMGVKNVRIGNLSIKNQVGVGIQTMAPLTNLTINKADIRCLNTGTKYFIYNLGTITNLYLGDISVPDQICHIIVRGGAAITNAKVDRVTGTFNAVWNGTSPTNVIIDGEFADPLVKRHATLDTLYMDAFIRTLSGSKMGIAAIPTANTVLRVGGRTTIEGDGSFVNSLRMIGTNSGGNLDNAIFLKARGTRAAGLIFMETNTHKQWYLGTRTTLDQNLVIAKKHVTSDVFDSTITATKPYFMIDTTGTVDIANKLTIGGGTASEFYINSDNLVIRNLQSNKDIDLGVNKGGSSQIALNIDGATLATTANGELTSDNSFAELFEDATNTLATTTTYRTITSLQAGDYNEATLGDSSMTITQAGTYLVNYSSSFTHAVNNTTCHISLFVNDVENTNLEAERKIGTGGDYGSMSGTALVTLTANAVLKLRAKSDNAGNLTINHLNFNCTRIK